METMIFAATEPGSFKWWFFRDFWSVIWTICLLASIFIGGCIAHEGEGIWAGLGAGSGMGSVACVLWPLLFSGCSGCGPWLDDTERAILATAHEMERQAKIEQVAIEQRAEAARIETEQRAEAARIEAEHKAECKAIVEQRLSRFSKYEGNRIGETIEQLKAAEDELGSNISSLREVILELGNNPEDDKEWNSWRNLLKRITRDRMGLEQSLEVAFLASERFRLAPSSKFKGEMMANISTGNQLANELTGKYRELLQSK